MTTYPERLPKNLAPINTFTFSTAGAATAKKECDLQLEALGERLKRISEKFTITLHGQEFNLIDEITKVCRDKEELKGVAKGLDRTADIIVQYDALLKKVNVLNVIEEDPTWLGWAFGDFSSELESDILKIEDLLVAEEDYET